MLSIESVPCVRSESPGMLLWRFSRDRQRLQEERRRESGWRPDNLRKEGFSPATVIDVGAGYGTPSLYEAFPHAYQVVIEPLQEWEEVLRRHVAACRGEYVPLAVGEKEGSVTIYVDSEAPWISSILRARCRRPEATRPLVERQIQMTTLDKLLELRGWNPPFALKIDTEGFENRVIQGATRLLEETQFVIAEVNVSKRFEGSYSFAEFIALMDSRGFALHDILDGQKASPNAGVIFIDGLFRRKP